MAIRDEDFDTDLTLVEGDDRIWSPSQTAPACAPLDLRSLYERERARAEGAEARCEELRRAELDSRSRASSLQTQLEKCRGKLKAAEEEIKKVRRTAKNALALQAEVTRLEKLLSEAGVVSSKRSTIVSLRMEAARLRSAVSAAEVRPRPAPRRSRDPEETIASLGEENARLKKEVRAAAPKGLGRRIKFLEGEVDELRWLLRGSHDHKERIEARHQDEIDWLKKDIAWLRERNERLLAATMRATGMIVSLREKIAGLRAQVRALEVEKKALVSRVETLEAQLAKLRASRTVLSKFAVRAKERATEEAAVGAQARPATRRTRSWPHPAARAR